MKCTAEQLEAIAKDSSYHDLGTLPSGGAPYEAGHQVMIRSFRLKELKLLSKAVELGEVIHLIRAVDNTISVPVEQLTMGDFFYVLLWLRLYSMPKSPYVVEWKCDKPYFTNKATKQPLFYTDANWPSAEDLRKLFSVEKCDTENTSVVHMIDTKILTLADGIKLPEGFDFPRMNSYVERQEAFKDPELALLAPAIQWIAGNTWAEKLAAAEADPALISQGLDLNRTIIHGIEETLTFNCRRCRVEHVSKLELNALSFFR